MVKNNFHNKYRFSIFCTAMIFILIYKKKLEATKANQIYEILYRWV